MATQERQGGRSYSGMTPEQRDAGRRERLLASGMDLFGTQGFVETTVEQLCSRAKVSTRHFYQSFHNKEDLFGAVYDECTAPCLQRALACLDALADTRFVDQIVPFVVAYCDPLLEDPRAARIAFVEIVGASPALELKRLAYREAVVQVVCEEAERAVEDGEITPRNFRFAVLAVVGAANSIIYDWVVDSRGVPAADVRTMLSDLAVYLLTGQPLTPSRAVPVGVRS